MRPRSGRTAATKRLMCSTRSPRGSSVLHTFCDDGMRGYTPKEKSKITAGAVTALVIVAWLFVIALAMLSAA